MFCVLRTIFFMLIMIMLMKRQKSFSEILRWRYIGEERTFILKNCLIQVVTPSPTSTLTPLWTTQDCPDCILTLTTSRRWRRNNDSRLWSQRGWLGEIPGNDGNIIRIEGFNLQEHLGEEKKTGIEETGERPNLN